jgi:general secretion pathway protein D
MYEVEEDLRMRLRRGTNERAIIRIVLVPTGLQRMKLTTLLLGLLVAFGASCLGLRSANAGSEPVAGRTQSHYETARAYLVAGNMDKANVEVRLALQENPQNAASHFLLGCLLEQKGENDQAIVAFQRASALDPVNADAVYNLGTMLLRRGEAVAASSLLENAVLIRPDHVPSHNNLGKAYFLAGLPELAVASYQEALGRDPANVTALKNLLLLAEVAGDDESTTSYRQRLKALGLGGAAKTNIEKGEPITLPTRAPDSSQLTQAQPMPAPEPQATPDKEADDFRELLRDLPNVKVERRADRLTLTGWTTGPGQRAMLDKIIGKSPVLDLTTDDSGATDRMIEIDAVLFTVSGLDQHSEGFNLLNLISLNFNYFSLDNKREGTGYTAPPSESGAPPQTGAVTGLAQSGWIFTAATSYFVNIANASADRVAVLAQPHLTALSGTPATFLAGGELVYKVSGINSGDIKPYPFGTTLTVTPTLLLTPAENGTPRVHIKVEAGRTSVLDILQNQNPDQPTSFQKVSVASEAVLSVGQTLILSGLSQRESRVTRSGVPGLMSIPILKYLFSTKTTIDNDSAVIILLTPRDPAFWDEQNRKALAEFVDMRRAYLKAKQGTEEDMQRFRDRYPDWRQIPPNHFASHFFLMEASEMYRAVAGQDMPGEGLSLELLGPPPTKKEPRR